MEEELNYALKLLGISRQELKTKMLFDHVSNDDSNDECLMSYTCIYTDGACPNNGFSAKHASIGIYFGDNDKRNISSIINMNNPTNNKAELFAILIALENSSGPVEICSDSKYAISCITKWSDKWEKDNWKTANGHPVKNKEIIMNIKEKMKNRHVLFRYVSNFDHKIPKNKTNRDHWGNYMADKLANEALQNATSL